MIFLKTNGYVKSYDGQTKWMYLLIEDDNLLEIILFAIKTRLIQKKIHGESDYNNKFLKTKIKSHCNEVTDFSDK